MLITVMNDDYDVCGDDDGDDDDYDDDNGKEGGGKRGRVGREGKKKNNQIVIRRGIRSKATSIY